MNARSIRGWLLIQPRPTSLKLVMGDEVQEITVDPKTQTWASIASTVEALDPDKVEVYDAAGKLLRAAKGAAFDEAPEDDSSTSEQAIVAKQALTDAETLRFRVFADHLAEAYKFATGVAFERMVDLFAAVNRRSESLEKSLDATHRLLGKAYQEQVEQALEHAEGEEGNLLRDVVSSFVGGAAQAGVEKAAKSVVSSPTNGKAAVKHD